MNDKLKKTFTCNLLIITLIFSCGYQASAQEKLNISGGLGLPELLNIGVRYQLEQVQIGFSVGSMPYGSGEYLVSFSGDVYYHFGGSSELSNRKPWYGRIGLNYLRDESELVIDKYFYLTTRFGRDFNISRKIGIEIDIGAIFQLSNKEIRKSPPSGWDFNFEYPVLPSIGVGLFYRI